MTCYHPNLQRCPAPGCQCDQLVCFDCGKIEEKDGEEFYDLITPIDVGVDPAPRKAWQGVSATVILVDITNLSNMTVVGKVKI